MSDDYGQKVTPKPGDRVRVTFEGKVERVATGSHLALLDDKGTYRWARLGEVEVIESEYEEGAMYQDANGDFFAYWPTPDPKRPWYEPGCSRGLSIEYLTRPLVRMVPVDTP